MSTFLIFAHRYTTIDGHFVDLYATRLTNFYMNVNNMATAMPQSTRAPPGGDNCSWRTLMAQWFWRSRKCKSLQTDERTDGRRTTGDQNSSLELSAQVS